jgi:hypothetical protein
MERVLLIVPVRTGQAGAFTLCTGRLVTGERTGLAFTSEASLLLALGPSQQWVRLDSRALRSMLAPLGISHVRIDPHPVSDIGLTPREVGVMPREGARPLTAA